MNVTSIKPGFPARTLCVVAALLVLTAIPAAARAVPTLLMQAEEGAAAGPAPTREDIVESAASLLEMLAILENDFAQNSEEGKFGDFEDFVEVNYITRGLTPDTFMSGFALQWYFNDDWTEYAIIALPTDDPEMVGLLIDSSGRLLSIAELKDPEEERMFYGGLISVLTGKPTVGDQGERLEWPEPRIATSYGVTIYRSSDREAFALVGRTPSLQRGGADIYLSVPETFYWGTPFDLHLGTTSDEILEYKRITDFGRRAVGTLRTLGSSQLAFQGWQADRTYGTFQNLVDAEVVASGYTLETMCESYRLVWLLNRDRTRFAIVALPTAYTDILQTYMIDTSQIVWILTPSDSTWGSQAWNDILAEEEAAWRNSGAYVWPEALGVSGDQSEMEFFLNDTCDAFLLQLRFDVLREIPTYAYLSTTGVLYEKEASD